MNYIERVREIRQIRAKEQCEKSELSEKSPSSAEVQRHGEENISGESFRSNPTDPTNCPDSLTPSGGGKCSCPQPVGAAGCGPKYPVCLTCGYTWHCKTCGGCRQCATSRPRTRWPAETHPAAGQLPLLEEAGKSKTLNL
jgi:hypothetical protein